MADVLTHARQHPGFRLDEAGADRQGLQSAARMMILHLTIDCGRQTVLIEPSEGGAA
jgi:hypothetical protein